MKIVQFVLILMLSANVMAQQASGDTGEAQSSQDPEEVVIIGERRLSQLRQEMWSAEVKAYELFNAFNDERRFEISCNIHRPTGSRFETQICQPEFERQANSAHGQAFLESYRRFLEPYMMRGDALPATDGSSSPAMSVEVAIASQQRAYRRKMRQVAEEHPAFLEAIIRYTELQERYKRFMETQ